MLKRFALACAVALTLSVQASPAVPMRDYLAVYQILPLKSDKPIGEYRISQRWLPERLVYQQRASINFSWQILLSTHQYHYRDEVLYGLDNSLSYHISENNDGKVRLVDGTLRPSDYAVTIDSQTDGHAQTIAVEKSAFDLSLFALRFPTPCTAEQIGSRPRVRWLIPVSGEVGISNSHYVGFGDLLLPNSTTPLKDLCQIVSTGNRKEMNRRAWINRDGYLVYEISADYRLRLVPEASRLPSNVQEKRP
ncbi:hypothetical protein ACQKDS_08235 [Serratia sp. NPDC078593]|uniref:hypothetical protein n=1 Tax=unclassified Serratia (in: enterobacteria) TaxID=2647522 RepID=UPI0037D273E1